jgi:hypothetical protein
MISRSQFSSLHRGPLAPRSPIVKPTPGSNRNSMQQARGLEICTIRSCPPEPAVQQTAGVRSSFAVSFLPRPDPGTRWTQVARKFDSLLEVMQQRSTAVRTTPQSTFKLPVNRRRWTHLKKGTKKTLLGAQRAGVDVDSSGAVMGTSAPQMRGAVLGRLKAEFSLVAMKAGCLRAFEALRGTRRDRD